MKCVWVPYISYAYRCHISLHLWWKNFLHPPLLILCIGCELGQFQKVKCGSLQEFFDHYPMLVEELDSSWQGINFSNFSMSSTVWCRKKIHLCFYASHSLCVYWIPRCMAKPFMCITQENTLFSLETKLRSLLSWNVNKSIKSNHLQMLKEKSVHVWSLSSTSPPMELKENVWSNHMQCLHLFFLPKVIQVACH